MGLGFGVYCERCGEQLSYDMDDYETKQLGYKNDLCGTCSKIIRFDNKLVWGLIFEKSKED